MAHDTPEAETKNMGVLSPRLKVVISYRKGLRLHNWSRYFYRAVEATKEP